MKKYKFSKDNHYVCTLLLDGPDADIIPDSPVAEKHLEDLRRLLPVKRGDTEITMHERHGEHIANFLRLLINNSEGVDLKYEEMHDGKKCWTMRSREKRKARDESKKDMGDRTKE